MAKTVDDYVGGLGGWQREVVERVCAIVREAAPGATEAIKWGQPVWSHGGPVCYVKAFSKAVNFGFWRGTQLSDPAGVLEGTGDAMRHVKLAAAADIRADVLAALVREAVDLNTRLGDPSRRAAGRAP